MRFIWFFIFALVFGQTNFVFAAGTNPNVEGDVLQQLQETGNKAEVVKGTDAPIDLRLAVSSIIKVFLGILGSVFLILIIMSGYWFMTAHGEEQKVEKAKDTIRGAIIGLAIVLAAYAITVFVTSNVLGTILSR